MLGLIGRKMGMTQIFEEDGRVVPVTVIKAGPCVVTGIRKVEKEGYNAVQLGMEEMKEHRVRKPLLGKFKKLGIPPMRILKEFRVPEDHGLERGQTLTVDIFELETKVDVVGVSKGHGFAGSMKRWGFHGFPATHGTKDTHRIPGSAGASADPARTWKNKKLPGHYGVKKHTAKNLVVKKIDTDHGLLFIKGAVPGSRNSMVIVKKTE